jgi:hypothetical protein
MATLKDSFSGNNRKLEGFRNMTAAALAINAGGAATFKTTSAYAYLSDGIFKAKTALAAQAFSAGHAVQAAGTTLYYTVGLDSAGAVTTYQGTAPSNPQIAEALANNLAASTVPSNIADVPTGITAVGLIKVVTSSAATFTPGTTALDAAGVTSTFYDVAVLPSVAP